MVEGEEAVLVAGERDGVRGYQEALLLHLTQQIWERRMAEVRHQHHDLPLSVLHGAIRLPLLMLSPTRPQPTTNRCLRFRGTEVFPYGEQI